MGESYTKGDRILVLENIRSAHNVGAIFRTAEAAGIREIVLLGYTPSPHDRFSRPVPEIAKTALGAEVLVPYKTFSKVEEAVGYLKKQNTKVVVVEQTKQAQSLFTYEVPKEPLAFVLGNEVEGVSNSMCQQADTHIYLPMSGEKESLNVAVCAGIVSYFILYKSLSYVS